MKLLRFKDNTYAWIVDKKLTVVMNETEAVAYGVWNLKINKPEVNLGLINLKATANPSKENMAIFGNINKLYLYTAKAGKDIDTTMDENNGGIA